MGGKTLDTLFHVRHDLCVFVTSYNPKSRLFWTWKMMIFNNLMTLVAHCVTILSSDKRSG